MINEETINAVIDSLEWQTLGTSEDTLSKVLSDCGVIHCEPCNFPLTDGLYIYVLDRDGKTRIVDVSVSEGMLFDPEFNGVPLTVKLSSPIEVSEDQKWFT